MISHAGSPQKLKICLSIIFITLFILGISTAGYADNAYQNLLYNADFLTLDSEGLPDGWYPDAWITDPGYTVFSVLCDEPSPTDGNVLSINNIVSNDARLVQTVEVVPESLYRFSAWIKTGGITEGHGANLSIEGLYTFSEEVFDTEGEWRQIIWYGETGEEQDALTLYLRVGGYSGESAGKAMFCGAEFVKVDEIPSDTIADRWYTLQDWNDNDLQDDDFAEEESSAEFPYLLIIGLVYTALFLLIFWRIKVPVNNLSERNNGKHHLTVLAIGLILALAVRIIICYNVSGYSVDVNCFLSWGNTMFRVGPTEFYNNTGFCDYPPAYTYILGMNEAVSNGIGGAGEGIIRIIYRFIPCLCDITVCLFIFLWVKNKTEKQNYNLLVLFLLFLAFNPVTVLNSAAWGQMDSVLCLALVAVAVLASEEKWNWALPCYMLSVLIKPQALMLGFLGLAALIRSWICEPEKHKCILLGLVSSAAVFAAIVIPFGIHQSFGWLINLYARTLGSYPYATVNTANIYYIFGGNWSPVDATGSVWVAVLFATGSIGYAVYWFFRTDSKTPKRLLEIFLSSFLSLWFIICAIIRAPWSWSGIGAMVFAFLIVLSLFIRKGDIRFLAFFGALLFILLYVFGIKMHERYIFPAFFLLAVAFSIQCDRRLLILLGGFSFTVFLNEGIVLDNSIRLGSSLGHLNSDNIGIGTILSIINIITALYGIYLAVDIWLGKKQIIPIKYNVTNKKNTRMSVDCYCTDNGLHWKRIDSTILALIICIYSFISFTTLGSTKAPQTVWTSSDYDENVVLDLGKNVEDFHMLYFAQVSRYDFSVAASDDKESWSDEIWAEMSQGQCWKWKYVMQSWSDDDITRSYDSSGSMEGTASFNGRYIRITAHQIGLSLCEVIFKDADGHILPVTVIEHNNANQDSEVFSDPMVLVDEQDTLEAMPTLFASDEQGTNIAQPSWWNSTYFDEIYHARTAYEFLKSSTPYETSHPPLGKILMSWGIAIFGMTPFGWRFAGALAGTLMLAAVYLMGKQLTKKTWISAFACLLMALDCMHLTQTQIATIDSFPVLFITFSYFFMLRFFQTDLVNASYRRILTDLGFCGLFMGFAIASKWIGIYAGAGLAVIWLWHILRTVAHSKRLYSELTQTAQSVLSPKRSGIDAVYRKLLVLTGFCIIFFIIIPVIIYLLSYIPYFAYNRSIRTFGDYLKSVWNAQTGMFSYHSTPGLGMDHPFYSPWYEWPVNGKPMFYATQQFISGDLLYSIFCFGNPAIWYPALVAVLWCFAFWIRERITRTENNKLTFSISNKGADIRVGFLLIGLLAQYLPWVLVPRGTYIYHYFASTPFLIFAIILLLNRVEKKYPRITKSTAFIWSLAALTFFILLYPYASGILAPESWLNIGKSLLRIWY